MEEIILEGWELVGPVEPSLPTTGTAAFDQGHPAGVWVRVQVYTSIPCRPTRGLQAALLAKCWRFARGCRNCLFPLCVCGLVASALLACSVRSMPFLWSIFFRSDLAPLVCSICIA